MASSEWDDADIAGASAALDAELEKIFKETQSQGEDPENLPEAEILPDDDDLPEAEIIDDEPVAADPCPISRDELAAIIEASVERGVLAALKKLGKY